MSNLNNIQQNIIRNCSFCYNGYEDNTDYTNQESTTTNAGQNSTDSNSTVYAEQNTENIPELTVGPSFLSVTNRFDFAKLDGVIYADDTVNYTNVIEKIARIKVELEQIQENLDIEIKEANSKPKVISFTQYDSKQTQSEFGLTPPEFTAVNNDGVNLGTRTDLTNIYKMIQYSPNYNKTEQKTIFEGAIVKLANWLDDYISNYDERVAEGKAKGDSEVKLSFLLRMRKAIENCDFPIGFGNDSYFEENSKNGYVVLGAYGSATYDSQYLNLNKNANNNNTALNHLNRSIILNAKVFVPQRTYKSESELRAAIKRGDFNYLNEPNEEISQDRLINKALGAIYMSSDDVYYNYTETYLASVLAHELIHSTHITNEAVTYNTCELIEDDFRNQIIFDGWDVRTQESVDTILQNVNLNELTYGNTFIPFGEGYGLQFHDLLAYDKTADGMENVIQHGHEENMQYADYSGMKTGNTEDDDRKELFNFVA